MIRWPYLLTLFAATLAPTTLLAQQPKMDLFGNPLEVVGEFEVVASKARLYREMTEAVEGHPQLLRIAPPKDHVFAVVELTLRFEKEKKRDEASIPLDLTVLAIGDETVVASGSLDSTTAYTPYSLNVLGVEEKGTIVFEPVFIVPESAKKATLRIGDEIHQGEDYQVDVEFEGKIVERPDPAERLQVKVLSAKRSDGIRDSEGFGDISNRTRLDYTLRTRGEIVTIEFELTANVAKSSNDFLAAPREFQIDVGDGRLLPALGSHDQDAQSGVKLSADVFSLVKSALRPDGTFEAGKGSIAFSLPKGAVRGKLLFYGVPVADFVIE
ncbi:MAG TPA: hypothetical protein VGN57_03125 [Pirellulaceae bacterium]|nr:hypothetical protein [Pirellulaceae bacterium]